jgi:hypothetical protein
MSDWIHLINPFDVATKGSRRKMLILITDHNSRLQGGSANAVINTLFVRTAPVKLDFSNKFSTWSVANGQWKGETNRVNAGLKELSGELIEDWDIRIQMVYKRDTPNYQAILPNNRIPFQNGGMDEKIGAVHTLGEALDAYPGDPALVTLKGEVDAFYTDLLAKRNVQQQKEQAVKNASDALQASRFACAVTMFRNRGILIDTYPTEPGMVTNYFQMDLIRETGDSTEEYDGTIDAGQTITAIDSGISQTSTLVLQNTGSTTLQFDIIDTLGLIGPTAITIPPGGEHHVAEGDIPPLQNYYLNIRNLDAINQGSYHVVVS